MNPWTVRLARVTALCTGLLAAVAQAQVPPPAPPAAKPAPPATKPPAPDPSRPVLHLANGGYAPGALEASATPGIVRWRADSFVQPFDFPTFSLTAVHWPAPAKPERPTADMSFELAGGDVVFGSLVGMDEKRVEIDAPRIGKITIVRSNLQRILRWRDAGDLVYVGPNGLAGWKDTSLDKEKNWREESGQLLAEKEGATIQANLNLPARAAIEFELSWTKKPDFKLALGVGDSPASEKRAFRFETWGNELIIQREVDKDADLAVVQEMTDKAGRLQLHAYLDQEAGELAVYSREGKRLAELKLKSTIKPIVEPGVELVCLHGDLRLEWLRISRWIGEPPRELAADQSRVQKQDGSVVYGTVARYDAAKHEFVLREKSAETRIPLASVASVSLDLKPAPADREVRLFYHDGVRISGSVKRVENDAIVLASPGVTSELRLPLGGLRSLLVLKHDEKPLAKEAGMGKLEMDGLSLPGKLVDGVEKTGSSCLAWQPLSSQTSSPFAAGAAGRIVYREPPPPAPTNPVGNANVRMVAQAQPAQGVGGMVVRFAQALSNTPPPPTAKTGIPERKALFLRDGDAIPAVIKGIDEKGVTFTSSLSASTFVPHEKLKAVELEIVPPQAPIRLTKSKRDRLLTLPRMQKNSPPTHLIRSTSGDYLRGRVVKLDDKHLELEIHLETKRILRDRIAQIIWLHADELDPAKKPASNTLATGTRVQALRNDGVRVTFIAEKVSAGAIVGKSDVLGPCTVDVKSTDQLMFGSGIEQQAAKAAYQQWKLASAVEPKFVNAGDTAAGDGVGAESPLVDKPAPDFTLDLLDGKKFHLAETKGKIVMLDFWATWCGPCIQAMPQVEKVAGEFAKDGVMLVAVNLQEGPDQIAPMLERHKLKVSVALDREGIVADKYKAVAIPQTVIIDRDGKVARLFVGGGTHLDDQLRAALKSVVSGVKPAAPAAKPAADAKPVNDAKPAPKPAEL